MAQVAAIVLAAGASSRLGFPKQLVKLGGEALLERAVRMAFEAELDPIIGVVSAGLPLETVPRRMIPLVNHEATEGKASSIRGGVRALESGGSSPSGVVILACDQPSVTVEHLRRLSLGGQDVLASAYAGRKGIPAYFPTRMFRELLALRGDIGARELLKTAKVVELPNGELDIDTSEDLERARELYEPDPGAGSSSAAVVKHP